MIKSLFFVNACNSGYGVVDSFSLSFAEALRRQGVELEIFNTAQAMMERFTIKRPDAIASFRFLETESGKLLCDEIKMPVIYLGLDSPEYILPYAGSPYQIICVRDTFSLKMFQESGLKNTLYLPHGAEKSIEAGSFDRTYPVVFFGSYMNEEAVDKRLQAHHPALVKAVKAQVDPYLASLKSSYHDHLIHAFAKDESIKRNLLETADIENLLRGYEFLIRARDRNSLLKKLKTPEIHVFGAAVHEGTWEEELKGHPNIIVHPPVTFGESLEIMKRSKIVLNSSPSILFGYHERILYALLCGALPLTIQSQFIQHEFEGSLLYYKPPEYSVDLEPYLNNEPLRQEKVQKGAAFVRAKHTWDVRASSLLVQLASLRSSA